MAHPVYPTFPTSPAPVIGDTFTDDGATWTYSSTGWVKTVIVLTSDYPIWQGQLVYTEPGGEGGGGGGGGGGG
jgi:hypothetical protein